MDSILSSEWARVALIFGIGLIALGPLFWSLYRAHKLVPYNEEGWLTVERGVFDYVVGLMALGLGLSFLVLVLLAVIGGALTKELQTQVFILAILLLAVVSLNHFVHTYFGRIRFNFEYFEYSSPWKAISVSWNAVLEIKMGMNGPTIVTAEGKVNISNTSRGFYQLIEMARQNDVKVQNSPYLRTPKKLTDSISKK